MNAAPAGTRLLRQQPRLGGRRRFQSVDRQLDPKDAANTVDLQDLTGRRQVRLQQQLRVASPIHREGWVTPGNVLGRPHDDHLRDARADALIAIADILRLAPLGCG